MGVNEKMSEEKKEEFLTWYKKPEPYEGVPVPKPAEPGGTKAAPWCDYAYKEWVIFEKQKIPDWWWKTEEEIKPLWSEEEQLMMERCMLKMHENIAKQKMTPMDRWWSTAYGIERDRCFLWHGAMGLINIASRILDSFGVIIKAADLARYPKLALMSQFLAPARFDTDAIFGNKTTYGEAEYGGKVYQKEQAALISKTAGAQEYGFYDPVVRFRTSPFLSFKMPDPTIGGYGQQLWWIKTAKEYLRKGGLWGVMPYLTNACLGPIGTTAYALGPASGLREFALLYKKRPDWIHAAMREVLKFEIEHGKLIRNAGTDIVLLCDGHCQVGPKVLRDVVQYHVELCKQAHYPPGGMMVTAGDFTDYIDIMAQAHGKYAYYFGSDFTYPIDHAVKKSREYGLAFHLAADWDLAKAGTKDVIYQYQKARLTACGGLETKYVELGPVDYWIPMENYDYFWDATRKYGSYPKGYEQP